MTPKRIAVAFLVFALASPGAASAMLVTWELEGTIAQIWPSSNPFVIGPYDAEMLRQLEDVGVEPGVGWRARMTFDSEAPGVPGGDDGEFQEFPGSSTRIEFLAGDFAAATPSGAAGDASAGQDVALPFYSSGLTFRAPMANASPVLLADSAWLSFLSNDATQPIPASLPSEPPDPSDFPYWNPYSATFSVFSMYGHGFVPDDDPLNPNLVEQSFSIDGRITSITRVPEPASSALVVSAIFVIALRRREGWTCMLAWFKLNGA